jgi:hypothetical protein
MQGSLYQAEGKFGVTCVVVTLSLNVAAAQLKWSHVASGKVAEVLAPSSLCNVDRVPLEAISPDDFKDFFWEKSPVVLQGSDQATFAAITQKASINPKLPSHMAPTSSLPVPCMNRLSCATD